MRILRVDKAGAGLVLDHHFDGDGFARFGLAQVGVDGSREVVSTRRALCWRLVLTSMDYVMVLQVLCDFGGAGTMRLRVEVDQFTD